MIDRRALLGAALLAGCAGMAQGGGGESGGVTGSADPFLVDPGRGPDEDIPLWPEGAGVPGGVPEGLSETLVERDNPFGLLDRAAHDVTRPILSLFRAREPTGKALLIIPGGGYRWVVVDKEGYEGARWFSRRGAHVYVLRYRLPHQGWAAGADAPLQDAQRAVRLIRARAGQDGVDPGKVMVMGFSAGGHLAGSLCARFAASLHAPVDAVDRLDARPDLGALIYPVTRMGGPHVHAGSRTHLIGADASPKREAAYDLTRTVAPDGPPLFLMHALDDAAVPVENSLELAVAARAAGVPAVLHTFDAGGHGFGMRGIAGTPLAAWPGLVMDWAGARGWT